MTDLAARPTTAYDTTRRAIFAVCNAFSLTRAERLDLATVLLNRNVDSYLDLDINELRTLRTALEGAALVCNLQMDRRRRATQRH